MVSKKTIDVVAVIALLVVIVGGYWLANYTPVGEPTGETKEFSMTAFQWGFEPSSIEVNQGDHVILHVTSVDVTHGIAIDEYGINEPLLPGKTVTIEFVANKVGTFTFYCSVACGAGHDDQKGQLVVKE